MRPRPKLASTGPAFDRRSVSVVRSPALLAPRCLAARSASTGQVGDDRHLRRLRRSTSVRSPPSSIRTRTTPAPTMCAARAYGKAGRFKRRDRRLRHGDQDQPGFYQAYANRALVQRRMNRDDLALADYNQSISLNPNYAVAYVGRGNIYRQHKQLDLALADFNQAITVDRQRPARLSQPRASSISRRASTCRRSRISPRPSRWRPTATEPFNGARPVLPGDRRLQGRPRRLQRGR